jgi:hypothetical protein
LWCIAAAGAASTHAHCTGKVRPLAAAHGGYRRRRHGGRSLSRSAVVAVVAAAAQCAVRVVRAALGGLAAAAPASAGATTRAAAPAAAASRRAAGLLAAGLVAGRREVAFEGRRPLRAATACTRAAATAPGGFRCACAFALGLREVWGQMDATGAGWLVSKIN